MAFLAVMLVSCENPISVVRELASEDTLAAIVADDITFIRSDSGRVVVKLIAPRLYRQESDTGIMEFPQGFDATFYNKDLVPSGHIRANYGISYGDTKIIEAKDSVLVENYTTDEKLNSDQLFWYQNAKLIRTRSAVKITTPDKIIFGDSLTAAEDFSNYTIHHITATLEVDDDVTEE